MTIDSPLDPRHARLVALLYDELPPAEASALRAELAQDASLRAEWDELNVTRGLLGAWQIEERTPSFVFLEPPATPAAPGPTRGRGLRLVRGSRSALAWSGWAVAAAALLFAGVAGRGTRIERLDDGFAVRLGPERSVNRPAPGALASVSPPPRRSSAFGDQLPPLDAPFQEEYRGRITPVATGGRATEAGFVTRADMDAHTDEMVNLVAQLLNEDRARRDREVTSMLRTVYGDLNDRQFAGYRDLRGRIEAVNVGLLLGRSASGTNPDGSNVAVPADTLKLKSRGKQPGQRNWKYGDFSDEPERF